MVTKVPPSTWYIAHMERLRENNFITDERSWYKVAQLGQKS